MQNERALNYWSTAPATIDGVLGGMEHVHEIDIRESAAFLESLDLAGRDRALDCGAGIGRNSKHLLCPRFKVTDLLEPFEHMLGIAKSQLPADRIGDLLAIPIEKATLRNTYDLIALLWVVVYLEDDPLVAFLSQCKTALRPGGLIFLKDNISSRRRRLVEEDNSHIRSDRQYKDLFERAGLKCIQERVQQEWPDDLFQAKMYALR